MVCFILAMALFTLAGCGPDINDTPDEEYHWDVGEPRDVITHPGKINI